MVQVPGVQEIVIEIEENVKTDGHRRGEVDQGLLMFFFHLLYLLFAINL